MMKPAEWYDFVPLPPGKQRAPDAVTLTHAKYAAGRYSGFLELTITTLAPVHIGTGAYELSEDADLERGTVVRGMTRVAGKPVIPSASLKGALRSVYETITYSCVGKHRDFSRERYCWDPKKSELPRDLIYDMPDELQHQAENTRRVPKISVKLRKKELDNLRQCNLRKNHRNMDDLCPTCALFGIEDFQGRLSYDDAKVDELQKEPKQSIQIPSLYGPRLHRLGDAVVITKGKNSFIQVRNLKGRKIYYNIQLGDIPAEGSILIDYLPEGTRFKTHLNFLNVTLAELGGLITALGLDTEHSFIFRVGGGKPVGLGHVNFELKGIHIQNSETAFTEFDPRYDEKTTLEECLQAFQDSEGLLFYPKGLNKLCEITARSYVHAEEEMT